MSGQPLTPGPAWSAPQPASQTPLIGPAPSRPDTLPTLAVTATGRFRKARVKPMQRYGAYRGAGSLRLDQSGIHVGGKHVRPIAVRWGIALAVIVAVLILSRGRLLLGVIPVYFLVEYGLLENGDRTIPWGNVKRFAWNQEKKLVAIETTSAEKEDNPLVLGSEQWQEVLQALRTYTPKRGY